MCSSWIQLAPGSRELSQAEKRITAEQIHKMTTISTQNDNFDHRGQFWLLFFEFAPLLITLILLSAWDKSSDLGANSSKLENM